MAGSDWAGYGGRAKDAVGGGATVLRISCKAVGLLKKLSKSEGEGGGGGVGVGTLDDCDAVGRGAAVRRTMETRPSTSRKGILRGC